MPPPPRSAAVFGPLDGDFDPFDDEEDPGPLVTFGRGPAAVEGVAHDGWRIDCGRCC